MNFFKLPDQNDFIVRVTLENVIYRLHFAWNDRGGYWALGVRDKDNNQIIEKIKCVPNYPLLRKYSAVSPTLPPGEFICLNMDDSANIARDGFTSGRTSFVYVPKGEVDAYA